MHLCSDSLTGKTDITLSAQNCNTHTLVTIHLVLVLTPYNKFVEHRIRDQSLQIQSKHRRTNCLVNILRKTSHRAMSSSSVLTVCRKKSGSQKLKMVNATDYPMPQSLISRISTLPILLIGFVHSYKKEGPCLLKQAMASINSTYTKIQTLSQSSVRMSFSNPSCFCTPT